MKSVRNNYIDNSVILHSALGSDTISRIKLVCVLCSLKVHADLTICPSMNYYYENVNSTSCIVYMTYVVLSN